MANVVEIIIKQSGQGNAISATVNELGGLDKAASSSIGVLGRFGSALGGMAMVAGGIVAANIFGKIAEGIGSFVSTGLSAVSSSQQLEASLSALLVQNNLYTQTTETMTVAVGNLAEMQADAAKKSDDLSFKQRKLTADINTQNASIQEQRQRIIQMADGLDKIQQVARLEEMEVALEGMNRELADTITEQGKLNTITQEYETVSKTTWSQVMDLTEAQRLAKEQTKELTGFVEKLAIVSPFEQEDVEKVTQYAVGAGLGVEATKSFTAGFLDLAAAVGINSANLDETAYQLLQVKKAGKLTEIDLRQLSTRGIDLAKIIGIQMGMSVEQFNAEAEKTPAIFDDLIQAVTDYSNNTFAGTSEAMSTSLEGFRSTISDLFTQSAKKILRPLVDAISPTISEMINTAASFITGGQAEQIGQALADTVMAGFSAISERVGKVMGAFERFGMRGAAVSILGQLGLDPTQIAGVMGVVDQITEAIDKISGAFERFGAKGAAVSILGMLGMDPETIGAIFTTFDTIIEKIGILQQVYAQFGAMGAGVSLLSMLGLSSESIALITTSIQAVMDSLTALANWWITTWPTIQAAALTGWEILKGIFAGLQMALGPTLTQLNTQFTEVFGQLGAILASFGISWSDVWNALLTATGIVATGIGAAILGIIGVVAGLATGIGEGISAAITMFQDLATNITGIVTGLVGIVVGFNQTLTALLSGDFANAWEGAKILLQGFATFFSSLWAGMITVAVGSLDILASSISGFVEGVVGFFQGMYDQLVGHSIIPDMINGIVKWFSDLPQKLVGALGGLTSKVIKPFSDMAKTIQEEVGRGIKDTLGELTDETFPLFVEGIEAVIEAIKNFISSMKEAISTALDFIVPDVLMPGSPPPLAYAFMDIAKGANAAGKAIQGVTSNLNLDRFAQAGRSIMQRLAGGMGLDGGSIKDAILGQLDFAAKWFHKKESLGAGERAIAKQALFDAFEQTYGGIVSGTAGRDQFLAAFQGSLGGLNPQEISEVLGVASDHVGEIISTIRSQFGPLTLEMKAQALTLASSFSSLAGGFADMVKSQLDGATKAKEEAAKLGQANIKLTETLGTQQKKMVELQADLLELTDATELDTDAIERKQAAITELSEAMTKNQETITKNEEALRKRRQELEQQAFTGFGAFAGGQEKLQGDLAMAELLQEFLAGTGDELRIVGEELGGIFAGSGLTSDIFHTRLSAQEELNRLLAEQAERERQIAEQQKAQQQLNFLQMQLDLLKQGQALGVNIFEGMTFGLNASASDLLAATNALVSAMVAEIDSSLQIASPSKVMFEKFRNQVGGGMVRGLMAVKPILSGVVGSMLSPLTGGDYSKTTNNNFSMTVNTRAEQSSVIGDFRTLQLMAG